MYSSVTNIGWAAPLLAISRDPLRRHHLLIAAAPLRGLCAGPRTRPSNRRILPRHSTGLFILVHSRLWPRCRGVCFSRGPAWKPTGPQKGLCRRACVVRGMERACGCERVRSARRQRRRVPLHLQGYPRYRAGHDGAEWASDAEQRVPARSEEEPRHVSLGHLGTFGVRARGGDGESFC